MDIHAILDPREYKKQYPDNEKGKPTGPLANKSLSGTFRLEDMLSDESLQALWIATHRK